MLTLYAPDGMLPATAKILAPRFHVGSPKAALESLVLWVGLRHFVDVGYLSALDSEVLAIATPTTGLTHIDTDFCKSHGIKVVSLQGSNLSGVRATAEHTIGLMLCMMRRTHYAANHVQKGKWDRSRFRGWELAGKRAAVIGYGRVGKQVAKLLEAFGCLVTVSNSDADTAKILPADIVTLHEDYAPAKRGKYGHKFFSKFKGGMFVNTARGELVDESALLAAMDSGKVGAAALDVVADEYKPHRMLADYSKSNPNLLVTPHIAGNTHESVAKTEAILARKLLEMEL